MSTQLTLDKFGKAYATLEAVYLQPLIEDRVNIDATIRRFGFTFELAWKFLKDYFLEKGIALNYPKEIIQEAFAVGLIDNEALWIQMLSDRNLIPHTYDAKLADEMHMRIKDYVPELRRLLKNVTV